MAAYEPNKFSNTNIEDRLRSNEFGNNNQEFRNQEIGGGFSSQPQSGFADSNKGGLVKDFEHAQGGVGVGDIYTTQTGAGTGTGTGTGRVGFDDGAIGTGGLNQHNKEHAHGHGHHHHHQHRDGQSEFDSAAAGQRQQPIGGLGDDFSTGSRGTGAGFGESNFSQQKDTTAGFGDPRFDNQQQGKQTGTGAFDSGRDTSDYSTVGTGTTGTKDSLDQEGGIGRQNERSVWGAGQGTGVQHEVDPTNPVGSQANKPSLGDKLSGKVDQLVGKVTNNPDKVEEGRIKATEGKTGLQQENF
ncbi:hypothetical protein T439DRAFT_356674 [Meredithblackwellia eburnea MCA 4105]